MTQDLSIQLLRGLIALREAGSLAGAAERLGRSESAVSLQMSRLESQTGLTLFNRDGRRLTLTVDGELLLGHARSIVQRVDAARADLNLALLGGATRLGIVQDFAGPFLVETLLLVSQQHPGLRVDVMVDRSTALLERLSAERLDVVLCAQPAGSLTADFTEPMAWFGQPRLCDEPVLPLAVVAAPCPFLDAATKALDDQGRAWRIAFETPSLDGVRAAVEAGLGIGCRTARFSGDLAVPDECASLPQLPRAHWSINCRRHGGKATAAVAALLRQQLSEMTQNQSSRTE